MQQEQMIEVITRMVKEKITALSNLKIPIGVSARHLHVTQEDLEKLFGKGHQLRPKKELMGGQYAAEECVTLVGTKLRAIENVRILGPVRSKTQVEVSKTDAIRLGLNPPVRDSGKLAGSSPITIVGPKGAIYLEEGCIVANRHIHMSPSDAEKFEVHDQQVVSVKLLGGRGGMFQHVLVRVHETFTLEMHIDTDEANAMGISCGELGVLVKEGE